MQKAHGENGDGKSTILKSLAIGLCDQSSASALFRELPGEFIRHGAEDEGGIIEVDLASGSYNYRIRTTISSLTAFERVEQTCYRWRGKDGKHEELLQDDFPWENIFASAYGAGVRIQGTADFEYYLTVDAVYPLFRYDSPLQNPELMVRRLVDEAEKSESKPKSKAKKVLKDIRSVLVKLLDLDEEEQVELTATSIGIRGRWGFTTLPSLGDGYKSVVTLVSDMLSWWFLKQQQEEKNGSPTALEGIVLIDEIEQHLHPKWQRSVISKLVETFPNVQFIATTHSPLVASGCDDVPVHKINDGKHEVVDPFGWLAEDVYDIMGLQSGTRAIEIQELLKDVQAIETKSILGKVSKPDQLKLGQFRKLVDSLPSSDPLRLTIGIDKIATELRILREKNKK